MANVSRPFGFRPVKHLNGSPYNGQFNLYEMPAADSGAAFVGDLVKGSTTDPTDVYPTAVVLATSGQVTSGNIIGAIVGFIIDPTNLNTPQYRVGSTKRFAMVADSPDLIFEVQDGGTVPATLGSSGANTGVTATAGSTTTGMSNMATGTTAPTTTSTLPLRIMGIVNRPDNESVAASQKLLVMINNHAYGNATTAVSDS